ncbi:MAG: putative ABC exporter domain-containing protein [Fimbriimonas sp.]
MQPLVFLTVRTLVNGVKRALTSPRRLIGMSVLLFYWFRFLTPVFSPPSRGDFSSIPAVPMASMPRLEVIDAILFGLFAIPSLGFMIGAATPRGGFRPPDVDVLFATPVNPRVVLVFRIVRDAIMTLLVPLFLAIFARPIALPFEAFIRNYPSQGNLIGKSALIAWLLMSLGWTTVGYAISLFVNRSDERSDRNKRIINGCLWTIFIVTVGFIGLKLRAAPNLATAEALAHHPLLRVVFFPATLATAAVMSALSGQWVLAVAGFGGLLMVILLSLAVAMTQVPYLYDQAAAKGFDAANMRNLQRSGDTYGMVAEQARKGKIRSGRFSRWVGRLQMRGASALLWKELLLQSRGALWQYALIGPIVIAFVVLPVWGGSHGASVGPSKALLLGFLGGSVLMLSLQTATSGFIELLRRVDLQKPLPLSSTATVFWEVLAKTVPTTLVCTIACLGVLFVDPRLWDIALGAIFIAPSLSLVLTAVVLLVTVLFPDIDDATQRNFRGLMMMLGCVIAASPGAAVVGVLVYFGINGLIIALPAVALNVGVAIGVSAIAGGLYAGFNPSE